MIKRYITTAILVLVAGYILYSQYNIYTANPWTRDAQVRAYIVEVTPRVTGQVVKVHVGDNTRVKEGDLLFEIDDRAYQVDLQQAVAAQRQASVALTQAQDQRQRAINLQKGSPGSVPILTLNNLTNAVEGAKANLEAAKAAVADAQLNLDFTKVYASTDGYITNFNLRQGAQVVANTPVVALIDEDSFWIEGFFKETDLQGVDPGDKAFVTLMMHDEHVFEGEIKSIGYGIAKQDGSTSIDLLPTVNPNFQWIRLAQRIPVKIQLSEIPTNPQLRVGMTASVKIIKGE